jgi:hypothetical protein
VFADVQVTSCYGFHSTSIDADWTVARRAGRGSVRATVLFPTWGRQVTIEALTRDGRSVPLARGAPPQPLRGLAGFRLHADHGAYRVTLRRAARGAARLVAARFQRADPRGGPTLALDLSTLGRGRRALSVRISPSVSGGNLDGSGGA